MSKTTTMLIRTPDGVTFALPLAGPISRLLAWLVDWAVVAALASVLSLVTAIFSALAGEAAQGVALLLYFALSIGYSIVLESRWRGQTLGKRLLRLRVMDAQGLRLKFSQICIRNLLRVVDMLPLFYFVGGAACALSRRAQRLGDLAANTVVVRIPKVSVPNLEQLAAGKYNSLRAYPHLEARLRQRVSANEAVLAVQALLRRELLHPEARVELFGELAAHFRCLVSFPAEALDGLTDEQYIRNVVDVLYRPQHRKQPAAPALTSAEAVPQQ
jgi:uncharacterized RDD family membrane protein YckC